MKYVIYKNKEENENKKFTFSLILNELSLSPRREIELKMTVLGST